MQAVEWISGTETALLGEKYGISTSSFPFDANNTLQGDYLRDKLVKIRVIRGGEDLGTIRGKENNNCAGLPAGHRHSVARPRLVVAHALATWG